MNDCTVFVGLDYHQASVQVCVMDGRGRVLANKRCDNDVGEIVAEAERFGPVTEVTIESCSGADVTLV